MLAVTFLVWISDNQGWNWSFGVCFATVGLAIMLLTMGKQFYRYNVPKGNPLTRILQVFVAAFRNRNLPLPQNKEDLHQIRSGEPENGTDILQRTDQFKFLHRAAIPRPNQEASTSSTHGPWSLCTIPQVEETKIIVRMFPIILSTIFMNTWPSIPVIPQLFQLIPIPVYDRIFVPIERKFTGIPSGIRQLQRIGVGLVLSAVSMAVAAVGESHRKSVAIEHNMVDSASFITCECVLAWMPICNIYNGSNINNGGVAGFLQCREHIRPEITEYGHYLVFTGIFVLHKLSRGECN
ncbi:hypothetical protein P3L10_012284 [Capsicum annuum]